MTVKQSVLLMFGAIIASISLIVYSHIYIPSGKYKITLYAENGTVIKSWETTNGTMLTESFVKFKDSANKSVRISGTIVIEDQ
jgi:hypothetical protein